MSGTDGRVIHRLLVLKGKSEENLRRTISCKTTMYFEKKKLIYLTKCQKLSL
jgi:hypothetical protein